MLNRRSASGRRLALRALSRQYRQDLSPQFINWKPLGMTLDQGEEEMSCLVPEDRIEAVGWEWAQRVPKRKGCRSSRTQREERRL